MTCDCDIPSLYSSKIVKTRILHVCVECHCDIQPGQHAQKVDALYDGRFSTFYTCEDCLDLIHYVRTHTDLELCCHGDLEEAIAQTDWVYTEDDHEEEYSKLPFYDEKKGVHRGQSCDLVTREEWLLICQGHLRLNPKFKDSVEVKDEAYA